MRNYHSSLIASRYAIRTVEILDLADAAAAEVDRVITDIWRLLLPVMRSTAGYSATYDRTRAIIRLMPQLIPRALASAFSNVYRRTRRGAAEDLVGALPLWILRQMSPAPAELIEELREAEGGLAEIGPGGISSREPARRKRSAEREKAIYKDLIFPGPTEEDVRRQLQPFVRPAQWAEVGGDGKKRMPEDLAYALAKGLSEGKTQQQIAKELLPHFEGQKARATRAARTFSMFIAHKARMDTNEQMGGMVVGYQVHATRDSKTRPHHAARDGTVYYRNPTGNQKGFDEMPRPPLEADGLIAWN